MRGRARRGLAVAGLSCRESAGLHGEGAPASNAGAPPTAAAGTGAKTGSKTGAAHLARGSVSEAEALKPRPDLPPAERALVVLGAGPAPPGQSAPPGQP